MQRRLSEVMILSLAKSFLLCTPHEAILLVLAKGGTDYHAIRQEIGHARSATSTLVLRAERSQLVQRTRNGQAWEIQLAPEGEKKLKELEQRLKEAVKR